MISDHSHNFATQSNNCVADHLFLCKKNGVDICRNVDYQCDGSSYCNDGSDEQSCVNSPTCSAYQICLSVKYIPKSLVCNGDGGCADDSNTSVEQCNNCSDDHLFLCKKNGVNICENVNNQCNGYKN